MARSGAVISAILASTWVSPSTPSLAPLRSRAYSFIAARSSAVKPFVAFLAGRVAMSPPYNDREPLSLSRLRQRSAVAPGHAGLDPRRDDGAVIGAGPRVLTLRRHPVDVQLLHGHFPQRRPTGVD